MDKDDLRRRQEMLDFVANRTDAETTRRIVADLLDAGSYASKFIDGLCLDAENLFEIVDWQRLMLEEHAQGEEVPPAPVQPLPAKGSIAPPSFGSVWMAAGVRGEGKLKPNGSNRWQLEFGDDDPGRVLATRLGEYCFNNAGQTVTLTLHAREADENPELLQAEVEVSPAPTKAALKLAISFPTGEQQTFTVAAPHFPKRSASSDSGAPLPAEAFRFGAAEWFDEWPLRLVLR